MARDHEFLVSRNHPNSSNDRVNRRGKDAFGLEAQIALPLYRTTATAKSSTKVWTGQLRRTNSSQGRARNLLPQMVFHGRPVYQEEHAAQLIMARRPNLSPIEGRIHLRRPVDRPFAFPCSRAADHTFQGTTGRHLSEMLTIRPGG